MKRLSNWNELKSYYSDTQPENLTTEESESFSNHEDIGGLTNL